MVVTEEDDVKSRDVAGDIFCFVLIVVKGADTAVPSAMEQSYDDIGFFLFSYDVYPFCGRLSHILEMHSAP